MHTQLAGEVTYLCEPANNKHHPQVRHRIPGPGPILYMQAVPTKQTGDAIVQMH